MKLGQYTTNWISLNNCLQKSKYLSFKNRLIRVNTKTLEDRDVENYPIPTNPKYSKVGTLGNHLSCSAITAMKSNIANSILLYKSFESASSELKKGRIDALWVPGAYPQVGSFIMDSNLKVVGAHLITIPDLVLAGRLDIKPVGVQKVFFHSAVEKLLLELKLIWGEKITVQSNPEASQLVLKYPYSSIAITNSSCAEYYGLIIYAVLRKSINMPFMLFESANVYGKM